MIFFLFSLFIYNAEIETFVHNSIYTNNLSLSLGNRGKWLFSEIEGGICYDYTSPNSDFGFSDLFVKGGANRFVRLFDISIFGIYHRPGRIKEGLIRNFSLRQPGFGFGMGLGTKLFLFSIDTDFEFIVHSSDPATKQYLLDTEIKFNPDTLTFGIDCFVERFTMIGQRPVNSVYLKPKVIFSGWKNFALNFGVGFLVSGGTNRTEDNLYLEQAGVKLGEYGIPKWKVYCGITSTHFRRKTRNLFPLRIFLVDEKDNPTSGLLSLADSGSFQVNDGEIKFDLSEGIYPISVYSENSIPSDTVVVLKEATDILLRLHEKREYYVLKGTVKDAETKNPIDAEIIVENSNRTAVQSDPETGYYRIYLVPGDYIIKVTSKGYFPYTSLIEIKDKKIAERDFKLLPVRDKKK